MKILVIFYMVCSSYMSSVVLAEDVSSLRFPIDYSNRLHQSGNYVTRIYYYIRKGKSTSTGWVWGKRKYTRYWSERMSKLQCYSGYQNYGTTIWSCDFAICARRISYENNGACTQHYTNDFIQTKLDTSTRIRDSGGICSSPETCTNCNTGFYANGPICTICPQIQNCLYRDCTNTRDNICKLCDGEVKAKPFWRAYTRFNDNYRTCQKACSWRNDSTRCFPGHCKDETLCECAPGFAGHHCERITDNPSILYNDIKLKDNWNAVSNPSDPNGAYSSDDSMVWTKGTQMYLAEIKMTAEYVIKKKLQVEPDRTGEDHYVTDWDHGIIELSVSLTHYRGNYTESIISDYKATGDVYNNRRMDKCFYFVDEIYVPGCIGFTRFQGFQHDDVLEIELSATNGGHVEVVDREDNDKRTQHELIGKTVARLFKFHFDEETPYQTCIELSGVDCSSSFIAQDITTNGVVNVSWHGWTDDLSGIQHYTYQVFELTASGNELTTKRNMTEEINLQESSSSTSIDVSRFHRGLYSILFTAYDNAGNSRSARQLTMFDNESSVSKLPTGVCRVTTASMSTGYRWVVEDTDTVVFEFKDRFVNEFHHRNKLLNLVRPDPNVDPGYDDKYGVRTVSAVDNVHGIVDFKVSYEVNSNMETSKELRSLTNIRNIDDQNEELTIHWSDGDRLNLVVRATDIVGNYDEEPVTVYRDATPPVIENLWLTRGNRNNIFIHNVTDFTKLTIEWDTYDDHSGIHSLEWKMYDNFTHNVVEHGQEVLSSQGESHNITHCETKYGGNPFDCYCTPFWGCFQKHFVLKPVIRRDAGLHVGKDTGVHDYDYYIEVKVTNIANLITTRIMKITVDTTPPHTGVVHDGVSGTPEIDYQQSKALHAHWEGFFDRESGVKFYLYTFSTSCQNSTVMDLDSHDPNVLETTARFASHTVDTEGLYFVTVVAFNQALEPSSPVCSDGVTVDTTTPSVKEVTIHHARVRGGLVTDTNRTAYWLLGRDRTRKLIDNVTSDCLNNATILGDIEMFPLSRDAKGRVNMADGRIICVTTPGSPADLVTTVSQSTVINISWTPTNSPGGAYDYEIGISKSASGGSAPDILGYMSSKQHSHVILQHTDLPSGSEFYIAVKTISKSNVEGIQVIGPCLMDTSAPVHSGHDIQTKVSEPYLVASWSRGDFFDAEDKHGMDFYFAIGTEDGSTKVQNYQKVTGGGPCELTSPPTCTAVLVSDLDWALHGHHTYYITVKVVNTAGLVTVVRSLPYVHDVTLASTGVVYDVPVTGFDIDAIDFQTDTTRLAARWSGFVHPHLDVTFRVSIGTSNGSADVLPVTDVGKNTSYTASHLNLSYLTTYYFKVEAVTKAGSVYVRSDGVTIVKEGAQLDGIEVYDGKSCNSSTSGSKTPDFVERGGNCDIDYQAALNTVQAHWMIPARLRDIIIDNYWAVELKTNNGHQWNQIMGYENNRGSSEVERHDLFLLPGQTYRSVLKFCSCDICYTPLVTNGFRVLSNPPRSGSIIVTHFEQTDDRHEKLIVQVSRFFDPDVSDTVEKYDVINKYEWAITNKAGKLFTKWIELNDSLVNIHQSKMEFNITLDGEMDFSSCKRLSVRGFNKVMMSTTVSADIKSCSLPGSVKPNVVIDAVGDRDESGNTGKPISLTKNQHWKQDDVDYIPYTDFISAVWPKLRHRNYTYAVINAETDYAKSYYVPKHKVALSDPCSHSHVIKGSCGETTHEFVNIRLSVGTLIHGQRYLVCIHAEPNEVTHETWVENLPEINTCSDGVVVDLTPPVAGRVWIGQMPTQMYQTTTSHMFINWDGFSDIEEFSIITHASGIKHFILSVGTSPGANDIVSSTNIGDTNHIALHNLTLLDGHKYYATIKAVDYVHHVTSVTSPPLIVDTTPPSKTDEPITSQGRHITSVNEVTACWKGVFFDLESSLTHYEWSIGSRPGLDDIMRFSVVSDHDQCAVTHVNTALDLHEGHAYFVNVKAFNGAGLFTLASSWAIVAEFSPPIKVHVYDGKRSVTIAKSLDEDFQTDTTFIGSFWEGFHDPHSTIKEYWIMIGRCKQCDDILQNQPLGITHDYIFTMPQLETGKIFYTTVTACNTADMCSSVTTDGVILDDSPPLPGRVQDGLGELDLHYQADRRYISAMWYDFSDPQSGLDRYEWWAGTSKGGDDVMSLRVLHLQESAVDFDIKLLPVNKQIYITVRAYNKAGLFSETTSNGFTVDTSPPIISSPTLSQDLGSLRPNTIVFRDCFKVTWTASDDDSYIEKQFLSLRAHRGGEFKINSIQVSGIVRDFLFTDLELHDGVNYYVTLIACNGAGLCSPAESAAVFVDSSPPTRGMFAIETDHAAELKRAVPNYMRWTRSAVLLTWIGFSDLHSNIDYYMITIGRSYMSSDLIGDTKGAMKISHTITGSVLEEGPIQSITIETENLEEVKEGIYISLWAVNSVGLRSEMINSKFTLVGGGSLELVRRCSAASCAGHCVCAPQDQTCHPTVTCKDRTGDPDLSVVSVKDIIDFRESKTKDDVDYTPSSMAIGGNWFISQYRNLNPIWYEWSFGYEALLTPHEGFDSVNNRVWFEAWQTTFKIITLPKGKEIKKDIKYSIFVKAWYGSDTFAIFKSNGIMQDLFKERHALLRVKEYRKDSLTKTDMDFIDMHPFIVSWTFRDPFPGEMVDKVQLYFSFSPKGHEIFEKTFRPPVTNFTFMYPKFETHVKIYSNIIAYSTTGIHEVMSSDGFIIDDSPPRTGVVYDGLGHVDIDFQSSRNTVSVSWHGFVDLDSGIMSYFWCVGLTKSPDECDILTWQKVGLKTSATANVIISDGMLYSKVFAVDRVGHKSPQCISDGVRVDTTSPVPTHVVQEDANLVQNPSFEFTEGKQTFWENVSTTDLCHKSIPVKPQKWSETKLSCASVISADTIIAKRGQNLLYVRGSIQQDINGLLPGEYYKVTFSTSHLLNRESVLANKEGFMKFADQHFIFLMYTRGSRHDHDVDNTREITPWHTHTYFVQVSSYTETLVIGSEDRTMDMLLDYVKISRIIMNGSGYESIEVHANFVQQWKSIKAFWSFVENESHIINYQWAIGHVKGGTQIQQFKSAGLTTSAYQNDVTLSHNSVAHVTVIATNSAGLQCVAHSPPLRVDLTPPNLSEVNDGQDLDVDFLDNDDIFVSWRVEDQESLIKHCEWAIGTQPFGKDIQDFTTLPNGVFKAENKSVGQDRIDGKVIYSTIRCENNAGLHSIKSSDGVRIVKTAPDVTHADLQNEPLSKTEYTSRPGFQSVSNQMRLKWTGFSDSIPIDAYIFSIEGLGSTNLQRRILSSHQPYTYVLLKSIPLVNRDLQASVKAVDRLYKTSSDVQINVTISEDQPNIDGTKNVEVKWDYSRKVIVVSWNGIFSPRDLYYEVSAGTVLGGGDIAQWVETRNTFLTLTLPAWFREDGHSDVFIIIRAVSVSGMNAVKTGSFFVPSDV